MILKLLSTVGIEREKETGEKKFLFFFFLYVCFLINLSIEGCAATAAAAETAAACYRVVGDGGVGVGAERQCDVCCEKRDTN